jgi:iron complex outermembrane receptor protein
MHTPFKRNKLYIAMMLLSSSQLAFADDTKKEDTDKQEYTATLPSIVVQSSPDQSSTKGYIGYEQAEVTRNQLSIKEIPQTVDVINIQKNKNYGTNDLSSILEGNAGIDASYDTRGDSIYIRGFQADYGDIYRDGIRESGQLRRSTTNVERVEILKGPASILYGRSQGGGVINMVSKFANFKQQRSVGVQYGSWATRSLNLDINEVINDNVAIRLTAEEGRANSFRSRISSENRMISPSITIKNGDLSWTGQYTYDNVWRTPDRTPSKLVYDRVGLDYRTAITRPGDYFEDKLQVWRSDLNYQFNSRWSLRMQTAYRQASQNFDHYYLGTLVGATSDLKQVYYAQELDHTTLSNALTLSGSFDTGVFNHQLTVGLDASKEERNPTLKTLTTANNNLYNPAINLNDPSKWVRYPNASALADITSQAEHTTESTAIFAQDLITLTPTVKLMLGGRLEHFKVDSYTHKTSFNVVNTNYRYNASYFSPNAGLVWDITPEHTAYTSFNRSFSPPGAKGMVSLSQSAQYQPKPEYSTQYEIGLKSDWFNKKLSTQISVYQLERNNIAYLPDPSKIEAWAISGQERSKGIEFSALGQLLNHWYVRTSLGLMQAVVTNDDASPARVGKHLSNTSNMQGNVFVRYAPSDNLYGEVGVTRLGARYLLSGSTQSYLPGFTRVDAMVGWNHANWNTTVGISNLFDKEYWRSEYMPGAPRAVTVKVGYNF